MPGNGLYRKANPARFDISRALIRQTWNRVNLYNLMQRNKAIDNGRFSMFKQRWVAKRETRAYHWDHISEQQFLLRHFTPRIKLPDMGSADRHLYPPTAMLCFAELERRLDVVVHRSLLAPSVWTARGLVVQGYVKVNGEKVTRPSTSLRDGDLVTVDPAAIALLTIPKGREGETASSESTAAAAEEAAPEAEKKDAVEGYGASEANSEAAEKTEVEGSAGEEGEGAKSEQLAASPDRGGNKKNLPNGLHQAPSAKHAWMKQSGKPLAFTEFPFMGPWTFVPEYLEVDYNICSVVFLRAPTLHPGRCEVPTPWPPEHHALTFEWYSRIYNRKTKRAPPEPTVVHGQPVKLKDKFRKIVEAEARARSSLFEKTAAEAERERILETGAAMIRPRDQPRAEL